jgi:hypothetical protein
MKGITLQEMSDETVQQLQANYVRQPAYAHTEGTASAYTVTLDPAPSNIADGFGITIVPHIANAANPTLNINGVGAIALKDQLGNGYTNSKLLANKPYTFRYIGTEWIAVQNEMPTDRAPIANPVFTGTPKVGSNTMIHSGNITSYVPPVENYDGRSSEVIITVGPGKDFSTISAAISSLKKVNAGDRVIKVTGGHVESSSITISDFCSGNIVIHSDSTIPITINGSVDVSGNDANIYLLNININGLYQLFNLHSNKKVRVYECKSTVSSVNPGLKCSGGGYYYIHNCEFSNRGTGIQTSNGSILYLERVTGTGNDVGIRTDGSLVMLDSSNSLTGKTATLKFAGGQIFY